MSARFFTHRQVIIVMIKHLNTMRHHDDRVVDREAREAEDEPQY
jgi:hypothetical protein